MPFVGSVRGTFGAISENRGVSNPGGIAELVRQNPNSSALPTGGTITVAGGYRIHTFSYTGSDQTLVLSGSLGTITNVECYLYAGGGGSGNTGWGRYSAGGGSGFAGGTISSMTVGTYKIVVGQGGGAGSSGRTAYGNGGSGYSWGNGGGGGLSGIFDSNTFAQANALLIAGGGGGGGASRVTNDGCGSGNRGGGGGGSSGQDGEGYDGAQFAGRGGTQSSGGSGHTSGSGSGESGSALQGANRSSSHGAGGGAGYFGGGAGAYYEPNTMGGGGGGSSYYKTSAISSPVLTSGDRCTTANTGGIYYLAPAGVSGQPVNTEGNPGRVVVRYQI